MARRARVDAELVRRGLARSRQQAAELIGAGKVRIDGLPAVKPATAVSDTTALTVVTDSERAWVSRGAHKLVGALEAFAIAVAGRRCLDAGASTGGFTEVLLDRGAAHVVAADVGYGQLAGRCATILGWWSSSGPTHVASHRRRSAVASTW
ncbi:Cytotoxin / haemolysin homologue TlyA [Mycobacterium tuberculosis]|nr:Cytotoxin / haemolysin homologue TlyA [Mycobacterium tuberculosis]